jgi:hypothetical protein
MLIDQGQRVAVGEGPADESREGTRARSRLTSSRRSSSGPGEIDVDRPQTVLDLLAPSGPASLPADHAREEMRCENLLLFPVFLPSENGNRRVARGSNEWPKSLVTCRIGCVRAGQESPFCQLAKVGAAGSNPVIRSRIPAIGDRIPARSLGS